MAFDDPVVWVLIIAVVIFIFGAGQIPKFARSIGQAKREFNDASNEFRNMASPPSINVPAQAPQPASQDISSADSDPLLLAARKEGIDTSGKTREQIASELSFKLNKT